MDAATRHGGTEFHQVALPTLFRAAADIVVAVHAAFVVFVVLGGLLVVRWRRVVWVHVPAATWGVIIEFGGWICPLTPLENYLRQRGGSSPYQGEFIEHYVLPLLYPAHLTRHRQIWVGQRGHHHQYPVLLARCSNGVESTRPFVG